ncbi:esterase, PHB depolymerase family [Marinobacterium lutimaris]|uniref:Esterase, PHB depolymerase family n=2 Tax=Marinobacterium lutimaris TaxID=568106 RepID=A0A1H6AQ17_9GAMM|nr:esterase, PHB depolymerase family [Marinobacterium lutimaris]
MLNRPGTCLNTESIQMPGLKVLTLALLTALLLIGLSPARAATLTEVTGFGSNPGDLRMYEYIPDDLPADRPLVVALHGCSQSASDYDDESGWVALAERWQFALLLPEQQKGNNSSLCFNWFNGSHYLDWIFWWSDWGNDIDRGEGEALSIKQMVDHLAGTQQSDTNRVFVTGLSAGGAMTAVMLATYPDSFAGGGIIAGIPYKCARYSITALTDCGVDADSAGSVSIKDLSPEEWGDRVRDASDHTGPWPRLSIWQGDADKRVSPDNARELLEQWANVHGIDTTPDVEDSVKGYPHRVYKDAEGNALIETYLITDMAHGAPVDPGSSEDQCGVPGGHILETHICASYFIGKFWGLDQ